MARRIVAAVAIASVLSGCAHVHRIDPVASEPQLDDLNRALQGQRVSVELVGSVREPNAVFSSGWGLLAEMVHVAADSTSLTLLRGAKRDTTLSTSAISSITITHRLRGGLYGLGAGFAVGGAIGGIMVWRVEGAEYALLGIVALGVLGSVAGLIYGTIAGANDVYDFAGTETEMPARQAP